MAWLLRSETNPATSMTATCLLRVPVASAAAPRRDQATVRRPMDGADVPRGAEPTSPTPSARRCAASTTGARPARGTASTAPTWPPTTSPLRVLARGRVRRAVGGERAGRAPSGRSSSSSIPSTGRPTPRRGSPGTPPSLCAVDADGALAARSCVNQARGDAVRGRARRGSAGATARRSSVGRAAPTLRRRIVGACRATRQRRLGWAPVPGARAPRRSTCAWWPMARSTRYLDCSDDAHGVWDYAGALLVCREAGVPSSTPSTASCSCSTTRPVATPVAAATPALLAELVAARRSFDQ